MLNVSIDVSFSMVGQPKTMDGFRSFLALHATLFDCLNVCCLLIGMDGSTGSIGTYTRLWKCDALMVRGVFIYFLPTFFLVIFDDFFKWQNFDFGYPHTLLYSNTTFWCYEWHYGLNCCLRKSAKLKAASGSLVAQLDCVITNNLGFLHYLSILQPLWVLLLVFTAYF